MLTTRDHPWGEIRRAVIALRRVSPHVALYQKFTCAGCGARLTMDVPNVFYETGDCDRCGATTDIKRRGCNYMAVYQQGTQWR